MEKDTGEMKDRAEMRAERPAVMDPAEFRNLGYLQEVNRRFLHPLGLGLAVTIEEDGETRIGPVFDMRDDPEGVIFAEITPLDREKAKFVAGELARRMPARLAGLGFVVQPVEVADKEEALARCQTAVRELGAALVAMAEACHKPLDVMRRWWMDEQLRQIAACQMTKRTYTAAHRDADARLVRGEQQVYCATCGRWQWPDELCELAVVAPAGDVAPEGGSDE